MINLRKSLNLFTVLGIMGFASLSGEESALVDVKAALPQVQVDMKYATTDNFTGQIIYDSNECFLLKDAVDRLQDVQAELETMGLGLKIFDGFRSLAMQQKLWEAAPDEQYAASPEKGECHTRGTAVDVTLVTKDGQELQMPSRFGEFGEKAHRDYVDASSEETVNRDLLQTVMERHGFIGLPTEWWHFDLAGWESYPVLESPAAE
jgi:D-alanyl-D-alanine dipeptidase